MTKLIWKLDPEGMSPDIDKVAFSEGVHVGSVTLSRSGRWRWEVVMLPGLSYRRDDFRGWEETEEAAMAKVQGLWDWWLKKAGLGPDRPDHTSLLIVARQWLEVLIEQFDVDPETTKINVAAVGPDSRRVMATVALAETLAKMDAIKVTVVEKADNDV